MQHFQPRNGELHVEDVPLSAIAERFGTPLTHEYNLLNLLSRPEIDYAGLVAINWATRGDNGSWWFWWPLLIWVMGFEAAMAGLQKREPNFEEASA